MTHLQARSEKEKSCRRAVIVSAAKDLFYARGYSVTVDEIAEKAKLSKATLYLYYKNKDELYVAAMLEGFQGLEERLTKVIKSRKGIEEKLKGFGFAFLDYMLENRKFFRMTQHYLAEEFHARISSDPAQFVQMEISRHVQYMVDLIQQGIDHGLFKEGLNARHFTTVMWRTFTGLLDLAIAEECADARTGRWGEIFALSLTTMLDGAKPGRGKGKGTKKSGPGVSKKRGGDKQNRRQPDRLHEDKKLEAQVSS